MRDVERIGYSAQKLTYFGGIFSGHTAACADIDDQWEKDNDTNRFIQAIGPKMFRAANSGNGENNNQQQAANREGALDMYELADPH